MNERDAAAGAAPTFHAGSTPQLSVQKPSVQDSGVPAPKVQPGAGGVVFNADGQVLLVRYRDGSWTFPKGHLEPGETSEQTALREVLEETGVTAAVTDWLPPTVYTNSRGERRVIDWFLMAAPSMSGHAPEGLRLEDTFDAGGFYAVPAAAQLLHFPEDRQLLWQAEQRHLLRSGRGSPGGLAATTGPLYILGERVPQVHPSAYIAPTAAVIGTVELAESSSVWFGAVLRGDIEPIRVGARSNVQDGAVLHTERGCPCVLEEDVTVGHGAMVHGAHCAQGSLIGMGATLLSGSRVGRGAIVGAGALLRERDVVPDGMVAVGVPARVIGPAEQFGNAERYVANGRHYRAELRHHAPTTEQSSG